MEDKTYVMTLKGFSTLDLDDNPKAVGLTCEETYATIKNLQVRLPESFNVNTIAVQLLNMMDSEDITFNELLYAASAHFMATFQKFNATAAAKRFLEKLKGDLDV